jgi:hypothetical protein
MKVKKNILILCISFIALHQAQSQSILPPLQYWSGPSESLVVAKDHPWITPAEMDDFRTTPSYEETWEWLEKLAASTDLITIKNIGTSAQHRPIRMIIASNEIALHQGNIDEVQYPSILVQAGIHSGEIDGKDAGMMLLRDIVFGGKIELLDKVNLLFVPILSVDAHENASPFHRPNQRGPENMGWRTNARNLNLNRDYTKLETEGIRAITYAMNNYDPVLYVDIHVTDGADYQYDITYGRPSSATYSPEISNWLRESFSPLVDMALKEAGHQPGPLIFTYGSDDFSKGIIKYAMPLRFSDGYGDARHLPSVLVENHSLKPYKRRVLGTYIFMEQMLKTVASQQKKLITAIEKDKNRRSETLPLAFGFSDTQEDSIELLLIDYDKKHSDITNREYTAWNAKPILKKVPYLKMEKEVRVTTVPKAYYLPIEWIEVIKKLSGHGIKMEILESPMTEELTYYIVDEYEVNSRPTEGRFQFKKASFSQQKLTKTLPKGSVRISTDQPLGKLAVLLLEPNAPDSFFQWGYFNEILSRTEYIESYVMEPLIENMLGADAALRKQFQDKKEADPDFASDSRAIFEWFYSQTPYFDKNWKVIPIGIAY